MQWWNKEYIYQIYPRTFCDTKKSGLGDINGIISKLDYLKDLGIGGIWICPIYKSPMVDNGYDIKDYYHIDPLFGSDQDFEKLLIESGKRNLKIIMDIVMNHTSNEHEWFLKALSGEEKYMNYYIFSNEPGEEKSAFGGSAWTFVPYLNKFYFHSHAKEQPDLNWENPQILDEFVKLIDFWILKGVKGFRFDVIDLIGKKLSLHPTKIVFDNSLAHEHIKNLNKLSLMKSEEILKVGETVKFSLEDAIKSSTISENELSMSFLFTHQGIDKHPTLRGWKPQPFDLVKLKSVFIKLSDAFSQNGWNSIFWNNHDGPRIVSRWGNVENIENWQKSAKMIFTIGSFLKGTPYIFQGEELGMTNHKFNNLSDFLDLEIKGKYNDLVLKEKVLSEDEFLFAANKMSRDHGRTWMRFKEDDFEDLRKNSSIPVNDNTFPLSVEVQEKDEKSILNYFKNLIKIRNENALFFANANIDFIPGYVEDDSLFFFVRTFEGKKVFVIANWSNSEKELRENMKVNKVIITNSNFDGKEIVSLKPYEVIVYE